MANAKVVKSTKSVNGGFVNTIRVEDVKKDTLLGTMSIKRSFYFKSPEQLMNDDKEVTDDNPLEVKNFTTENYHVMDIESVNEEGEVVTRQWLQPLV